MIIAESRNSLKITKCGVLSVLIYYLEYFCKENLLISFLVTSRHCSYKKDRTNDSFPLPVFKIIGSSPSILQKSLPDIFKVVINIRICTYIMWFNPLWLVKVPLFLANGNLFKLAPEPF